MSDELKQEEQGGQSITGQNMFGITKETKEKNIAQILVATQVPKSALHPSGWAFPVGNLVNVVFNPELKKKDGSTAPVLQFVFRDKDKRQHTHTEWEIEGNDAKFAEKLEGLKVRVKHIYTTIFGSFPEEGIGTKASNFPEFFSQVAHAFNSQVTGEGENAKKIYPTVNVYIKLTYYKSNLGFPLSPNFLEKAVQGQPCKLLTIDPRYDKIEPEAKSSARGIPGLDGGVADDDLPSFENGYS